jgi:putative ABC transport system permease protein
VIILTRGLGEAVFPGVDPLGKFVRVGKPPSVQDYEVIGVLADVPFRSPRQRETRMFFAPCREVWKAPQTSYVGSLAVRAWGRRAEVESAVRHQIESLGKYWVFQAISWEEIVAKSTRKESILATIATGFGAFTLVLACAGIYALIDMTTVARRREIGIRMALGANKDMILLFVLRDFVHIVAFGACIGLTLTVVLARAGHGLLYGMANVQPFLMLAMLAVVIFSVLAVALLRAWSATRLDPGSILRLGAG